MHKRLTHFLKRIQPFWPFIVFALFVLYFTRKFLFHEGYIFYSEFLGSRNYAFLLNDFLKGWGEYASFGHSNIGLTTSYGLNPTFWILPPGYFIPLLALLSFLQLFFQEATGKAYIVLGIIMPFIGMYFFAHYWFRTYAKNVSQLRIYSFLAAFIYSVNFIMGDRIAAAHLRYNLAHGLFPLLLLATFLAIDHHKKNLKYILASGLIIGILVWLMPHLLTLYVAIVGLYYILVIRKKELFFPLLKIGIFSILIGFLLNIHIWLPAILYPEPLTYIEDPQYIMQFVYLTSKGMKYMYAFFLAGGLEDSILSDADFKRLLQLKTVLIFLAVFGLYLEEKRRSVFLFVIAIIGIIFSLGVKYPFEEMYGFLFKHVFLFKPFREVGKFLILYLLSVSLLVPMVFMYLKRVLNTTIFSVLVAAFMVYILAINPNFTSGNFSDNIIPFKLPEKYTEIDAFLSSQKGDFRVAVYPNTKAIGDYEWFPQVRTAPSYYSVFQSLVPLSKDLVISHRVMTDYQSRYLDYIESNLGKQWAIERLGDARVRYLIVDPSIPEAEDTIFFLDRNDAVKRIKGVEGFIIYEVINYTDKPVTEKQAVYYFGNINGMHRMPSNTSLINLGIESNGLGLLSKKYSDTLVLFNASPEDLFHTLLQEYTLSFFPEVRFPIDTTKEFYVPAAYLYDLTHKGIMYYNNEIIQTVSRSKIEKNLI